MRAAGLAVANCCGRVLLAGDTLLPRNGTSALSTIDEEMPGGGFLVVLVSIVALPPDEVPEREFHPKFQMELAAQFLYENEGLVWSGRRDSNPRRQAWEACILPLNYSRNLAAVRRAAAATF